MDIFNREEVKNCIRELASAEDPSAAVFAWSSLGMQFPKLSAMVALKNYENAVLPDVVKKYTKAPNNFLVPYFSSEKMYFLDDELLSEMFSRGEFKFRIDYSLMFDTNIASYVNKLVRGEPLGNLHPKVVALVDDILHDDINFDHLFYMVENVKNVLPAIENEAPSKIKFWRSLNKKFRQSLISLQIFRSIDCQEYQRTCNPRPRFTYREAARNAIQFSYDFYASEVGRDHMQNFVLLQRIILLYLLGMVRIQLSSNKSAKAKIDELFHYAHNVVGAYLDRESIVAHKYFSDRNHFSIFEKIKKGTNKKGLLKRLDNIAWDMAAPRFMEKLITAGGEGRFFIPLFLTFDTGLQQLLRHYAVKGALLDKDTFTLTAIPEIATNEYFEHHGCKEELMWLHSPSVKKERLARPKHTRLIAHKLIRKEYKKLRKLI